MSTIVARGLTKRYGATVAVDDVTFTIGGGVVGLLGPNGAGKSTTLGMLLGLIAPTTGGGEVLGSPIDHPSGRAGRVGALIEEPALYPELTGRANLAVHARLGGYGPERVDDVLQLVGMGERGGDRVRTCSRGMRQRLGIAIAVLADPEVLLLDEPTNGLDPEGAVAVRGLLRELGERGTTVLVSSHLLAEVEAACDRVLVLRHGRVVFDGSVEQARGSARSSVVLAPERDADLARLLEVVRGGGFAAFVEDGAVVVEDDAGVAAHLNRLAAGVGITLRRLESRRPSLEHAFLALTGSEAREDGR